jgi:uncharacterized protein YbjT (DUF2867 family)
MNLLVFGASGHTGKEVVREATARGPSAGARFELARVCALASLVIDRTGHGG